MGKIKRFDIEFSNANGVFYSGTDVTGKVVAEIVDSSAIKVRAVKIKFFGEASVSFTDSTKSKKSHAQKEQYFEQIDILLGQGDTTGQSKMSASSLMGDSAVLDPGVHEFPFVFKAPSHLPSSFESSNGYVRYWCKAYFHRPWKFDNTTKKAFSIVSIVDLNAEPLAFTPGYAHAERRFSFADRLLCCVRGGLSVTVRLSRGAFVPGEEIPVSAEVSNMSTERVKRVEAYLQQNVIYSAKSGSKFCKGETKIGLITHGAIGSRDVQNWVNERLAIPSLPPSRLGGCKLINVDYLFNFLVVVENADNISLTIPVIIGTIPLRQTHTGTGSPPPRPPPPSFNRMPSAPPLEDVGDMPPPPSYEECVYMDRGNIQDADDNQYTTGDTTYRPLYPIYATLPQPSTAP